MDGLTCNKTVTLVHHIREKDTDTYACHVINGASWYEKLNVSVSSDGARPKNVFVSRIPEKNMPDCLPETTDFLVLGAVEAISRPSDLKGKNYFQITSVSDNRRNCLLPHVRVSGS